MRDEWVGIDLWGPPIDGSSDCRRVLGFATYSPKSPIGMTAAALARDAQGIALYHDGRVFTRDGRPRPHRNEPMTNINGRLYNRIASIDDDCFFDRVMEYHFSRLNSNLSPGRIGTGKAVKGSESSPSTHVSEAVDFIRAIGGIRFGLKRTLHRFCRSRPRKSS